MFYSRKTIRLLKYDYSQAGYYFVTICVKYRIECFGEIQNDIIELSRHGVIAENLWKQMPSRYSVEEIDEFVVMPNHLHGIIMIKSGNTDQVTPRRDPTGLGPLIVNSLSSIINHYKGAVKKELNRNGYGEFQWQPRFYDSVIRDEQSLNRIREYIKNNPLKWELDKNNPENLWM